MISGSLTLIPQNSITDTKIWDKRFSYISDKFLNKLQLVPIFFIWHETDPVFLVNAYFYYLPMISGKLAPIPQNSITKTSVGNEKFFSHLSQVCQ